MSDERNHSRAIVILLSLIAAAAGLLVFWRRQPDTPRQKTTPAAHAAPVAQAVSSSQFPVEPAIRLTFTAQHRVWLARILALAATVCIFYSSLGLGWTYGIPIPQYVEPLAVSGVMLLGTAIWLFKRGVRRLRPTRESELSRTLHLRPFAAGILLMILSAEANIGRIPLLPTSMHIQVGCFFAGIILIVYGLGGVPRGFLPPKRIRWRVLLPLLLITLLGLIVRLWDRDNQIYFLVDELLFINPVTEFRHTSTVPIFGQMQWIASFARLYVYLEQPFVWLFGYTLSAIRLLAIAMGTLTIPAVYLVARNLFDRKTALIAALLIATFPPHIHFSRLALNNIADPLFGALAIGFLAQGLRRNHRSDYVLAGVMLGLSHYFYEGGRLVFSGVVLFWLVIVLVGWRPLKHWRGILLFLVAFLLVILPLYYVWGYQNLSFTSRLDHMGGRQALFSTEPFPDALSAYWHTGVRPALLHIFYTPDGSAFYYGGTTGLVLWFLFPALVLGIGWCLWKFSLGGWLLLIWIAATIFGNSLIVSPDWPVRFLAVFPALAVLMAAGIRCTLDLLWQETRFRRLKNGVLILLVGVFCTAQTLYYHTLHIPYYNDQFRPSEEGYDALLRATEYPDGSHIYIVSDSFFFWHITDMLAFWDRHFEVWNLKPAEFTENFISDIPRDRTLLFFIHPMDTAMREVLEQHFTLEGPYWSDNPYIRFEEQYRMFVVRPSD